MSAVETNKKYRVVIRVGRDFWLPNGVSRQVKAFSGALTDKVVGQTSGYTKAT